MITSELYVETILAAIQSEDKPAKYVAEVIAEDGEKLSVIGVGDCYINLLTERFSSATDVRNRLTPALEWDVKHMHNKPVVVNIYELAPVATADVGRIVTAELSHFSPLL